MDRLEAVVCRLEALEARLSGGNSAPAPPSASSAAAASAGGGGEDSAFVRAFDDLVSTFWAPVERGSKAIGTDAEKIIGAFKEAVLAQRAMLVLASKNKKPSSPADLQTALKATTAAMEKVESLKDRRNKHFNHLAMVAEGAACLQWVCVEPTPVSFLGDVLPGSEMYGNKIIMEFKGKEEAHVAFAKDFKAFLVELQKYVKEFHKTGLTWNSSGGTSYTPAASRAPAPASAAGGAPPGPPPPPPPPPAGFFNDVSSVPSKSAGGGGHAALFAELEAKGAAKAGAAGGLRKVSKDEMTHKNPALRASSVVPDGAIKNSNGSVAAKSATVAKKPPKMEQNGSKWLIENFDDKQDLQIDECTAKTAVLFVKCTKSLLQIPGKINTLSIDSCVKSQILVDSCVASIEIINCSSVQLQITGTTPMITMDGCSGVIVYLSQQCIDDDIAVVSSKCSEMNIVLPGKCEEEDPTEIPVPEQFETRIRNGKLETSPISHVGA